MKIENTKFDGIFYDFKNRKKVLLTKNLTPGLTFFNEGLDDYREFDPKRSKLSAAIMKGLNFMPIKKGSKVLYLGASHGYTCSFVSDIIEDGYVYCLDFSSRVVRDLVYICEKRENMAPLLEDANKPETYKDKISEVNIIYMDIAQRNQVQIFLKNIEMFLSKKDYALIAIKSRSIDVTKRPQEIFRLVEKELEGKLKIIDKVSLEPYQRDHYFYVCQLK